MRPGLPVPPPARTAARRGARVALGAGAAAALTVIAVLLAWRGLAIGYYTQRLRGERELLLDMCVALPGSPGLAAAREFVRTPKGKERLLDLYIEAAVPLLPPRLEAIAAHIRRHDSSVLIWSHDEEIEVLEYTSRPICSVRPWNSSNDRRDHLGRPLTPLLAGMQRLLLAVGYDRYPLPGAAGLTFSVITRRGDEERILGSQMGWGDWTEGHVALIEPAERQWPRSP